MIARVLLLALLVLGGLARSSQAVLIFEKGKDKETRGYLVEETKVLVRIRELLPDVLIDKELFGFKRQAGLIHFTLEKCF